MENNKIIILIGNALGIAMGIGVVVLNILNELEMKDAITMIGIGLFSLSLSTIIKKK